MIKNYKNVLAFFAHPDDETLAAGATIKLLTSTGSKVTVAIPSTGIFSRSNQVNQNKKLNLLRKNCLKALKILGINKSNIYFGEFSDNEMDKHTLLELVKWLEKIIKKIKPDLVLTHHRFCTNIDHQYCHEAAVVATRSNTKSHIPLISCEVPSSTGYLKPTQWEPNLYVEVKKKHLDAKIKAMQAYHEEKRSNPHPRSPEVLRAIAKVRGSESGYMLAESFMIEKIY
tara:strand:- start:98 stop:781 length:684 start_codon:yes stop_codon:yes gene_type:complete